MSVGVCFCSYPALHSSSLEQPSLPPARLPWLDWLGRPRQRVLGPSPMQLVYYSGRAWSGAAAAVCSIRPFLLWSLLCSSHLINNDCTSHWNFPFSIFTLLHGSLPTTQLPPDQQQDKWCPTTWWLATATPPLAGDATARLVFQAHSHDSVAVEGTENYWSAIVNYC